MERRERIPLCESFRIWKDSTATAGIFWDSIELWALSNVRCSRRRNYGTRGGTRFARVHRAVLLDPAQLNPLGRPGRAPLHSHRCSRGGRMTAVRGWLVTLRLA